MFTIHQRTLEYWKDKRPETAFTFYIEKIATKWVDTRVILQVKNE